MVTGGMFDSRTGGVLQHPTNPSKGHAECKVVRTKPGLPSDHEAEIHLPLPSRTSWKSALSFKEELRFARRRCAIEWGMIGRGSWIGVGARWHLTRQAVEAPLDRATQRPADRREYGGPD